MFDTDGDGRGDGSEANVQFTNPLSIDTDGDGHNDYNELITGKDPLDPNSHP